ncbi:MAG: HEPN domain-containing protein [Thermodesulfovibrionales bacterium]
MKESLKTEERIAIAKYRKEKAYERLKAAEILFSQGFYNDAISRAYYSIHAISRAILILYDIRASTHEGVKTMLSKELIRDARILPEDFAKKFSILKALREDVDYEDFVRYSKEDAEEALRIAKDFVEKTALTIDRIVKGLEK